MTEGNRCGLRYTSPTKNDFRPTTTRARRSIRLIRSALGRLFSMGCRVGYEKAFLGSKGAELLCESDCNRGADRCQLCCSQVNRFRTRPIATVLAVAHNPNHRQQHEFTNYLTQRLVCGTLQRHRLWASSRSETCRCPPGSDKQGQHYGLVPLNACLLYTSPSPRD